MEKRDRFMLEQKLMDCWHVTDDIQTVAEFVATIEGIDAQSQDRLLNMLFGMRELYHLKFEHTMDLFSELIREGHIR